MFASKPHIAAFELATYNFLKDLITENDIPCDWHSVGGVASLPSQEVVDIVAHHLAYLGENHPELADKATLFTDASDLEKLRVRGAKGAVLQPNAAKCWPYKLVAWVLEELLREHGEKRFNLQTKTPVTSLQREGESWILHTPRGQVATKSVLLATNAYTSHLLPRLSGLIVPVRGQICALEPSEGSTPLEHSHVFTRDGNDDYLIQRGGSGELILGGERFAVAGGQAGISHDDVVDPEIGQRLRRALHSAVTLKPGASEGEDVSLKAAYEWTGIMGYSKDMYPWVGRVPESLGGGGGGGGLWVSGGYTGHGMPVAARCAVAVAEDILGRESTVDVPKEFCIDQDRPERARAMVLPTNLVDEIKMMIG